MNNDLDLFSIFNINKTPSDNNYYLPDEFASCFRKTGPKFSLLHVNARSLNKNFDSLKTLLLTLNNFPFSIIGVTETWLHNTSPDLFNLQNYTLIRLDREEKRGGGVAFYINEQLKFKIRKEISLKQSESLFLEIINPKIKNIIVGLIYRPPHGQTNLFCEDLDKCLHTLTGEGKQIYLMGDLNIDLLSHSSDHDTLLYTTHSNCCYPHINKPTRIDGQSSTLIDNIFSNIFDKDITSGLIFSDISDHLPIFTICKNDISIEKSAKLTMYRKETPNNIESFKSDLATEEWLDVFNELNANIAYDNFNKKLQIYYEKKFPLVSANKKSKRKMPWITKAILRSIRTRNKLYKAYLKNSTIHNKNKYKTYRNRLTNIIRTSRKMYYSDKLNTVKSNMKATWEVINDLIGKKKKTKKLPNDDFTMDDTVIKSEDVADTFNFFFVNIGPTLANKLHKPNENFTTFLPEPTNSSLFFNPTDPHEITEITKNLKSSKSQGHDRISASLLKPIICYIASHLTHIFNLSISTGKCPESLKVAKVNPVLFFIILTKSVITGLFLFFQAYPKS